MKKYLSLLLTFFTITTSATAVEPPPSCFDAVNPQLQEKFHITFQDILNNPNKYGGQWAQFKQYAKGAGLWDNIVNACCPQCSIRDPQCFGCSCNIGHDCMWTCRCCWVEGLACGKEIKP